MKSLIYKKYCDIFYLAIYLFTFYNFLVNFMNSLLAYSLGLPIPLFAYLSPSLLTLIFYLHSFTFFKLTFRFGCLAYFGSFVPFSSLPTLYLYSLTYIHIPFLLTLTLYFHQLIFAYTFPACLINLLKHNLVSHRCKNGC